MKKILSQFLAAMLAIILVTTNFNLVSAADLQSEILSNDVNQKEIQPIEVSVDKQEELSQEDISYYQDVVNEINNFSSEKSITIDGEDNNVTVYSIDSNNSNDENLVLQEIKYTNDKDAAVALESYTEITVPQTSDSELGNLSEEIIESDIEEGLESNTLDLSKLDNISENKNAVDSIHSTEENNDFRDKNTDDQELILADNKDEFNQNTVEKADHQIIDENRYDSFSENRQEISDEDYLGKEIDEDKSKVSKIEKTVEETETIDNPYVNNDSIVITAEELLNNIKLGDNMSFAFAKNLGFGTNKDEILKNLQAIVDEYKANKDTFIEPQFEIHNVGIGMNKDVSEITLNKNSDGTYTVSLNGKKKGYKTTISVESQASVTIVYDEKGAAEIERKVKSDKPTDFVITLDISGSMETDGRDKAMFTALKTLLDEILENPKNTVSIVLFASEGAVLQLDIDKNGIVKKFSGEEGHTSELIFDSNMVNDYGEVPLSLGEATIQQLEDIYRTSSGTCQDTGLKQALKLLDVLQTSDKKNAGVILFTDGEANNREVEYNTVELEKMIAEQYGATIVNVSIGDENQVSAYERYLDPQSDNYYDKDNKVVQDHVLYYNIPKLTDKELADKVTQMFETAFEDITTEKKKLQTETITDGVLAAYASTLIETIPAGFEIAEIQNSGGITYQVIGKDENGNTLISFDLSQILSGDDITLSYCIIPINESTDISVTAYKENSETVLYTEPIDKINEEPDKRKVKIIYTGDIEKTTITTIPGNIEHQGAPTTASASTFDDVLKYYDEFEKYIENYCSILKNESQRKLGGAPEDLVSTKEFAKEIREEGWVDVVLPYPLNEDKKAEEAVYMAIADIYKEMLLKSPQFSSIDFSNKTKTGIMSAAIQLVNTVKDSLTQIDKSFTYNGYTIDLVGIGIFSSGTSSITITHNGIRTTGGTFVTTNEKNQEVIAAYMNDLSDVVKNQTKQALFDVLSDFGEVTGLSDFAKDSVKETLGDYATELQKAGFGDVLGVYVNGHHIYEIYNNFIKFKKMSKKKPSKIKEQGEKLYEAIKEISFKPDKVNDWAVKYAMKDLEKAKKNLETALFNYIYEGEKEREKYEDEKNVFDNIKDFFSDLFGNN